MLRRLLRRSSSPLWTVSRLYAVAVENRIFHDVVRHITTDPVPAAETSRLEEGLDFAWKWDARCHIWNLMEAQNLVLNPRPVHHRVPNFKGADAAALALAQLEIFQKATSIAISPVNAFIKIRELALRQGKTLYVPRPSFKDALFGKLSPRDLSRHSFASAAISSRLQSLATPLTETEPFTVDLVVIGSVAVDAETGNRVGNGDGYGDLEYALLRELGAATKHTQVVTAVHDIQVQDRVAFGSTAPYDTPVDLVVTPTRLLYPERTPSKPFGLLWPYLSPNQLQMHPALGRLKQKPEEEAGVKLPESISNGEDWSTLPLDVIINIARHCGRREIQSCRLLNRHWSTGANFAIVTLHVTQELLTEHGSFNEALLQLSQKFRNIEKLTVDSQLPVQFGAVALSCPDVTVLDLFGLQLKRDADFFKIADLKRLQQLNLGRSNITCAALYHVRCCALLQTLDLWRTNLSYDDIGSVLSSLPNLTNLNLGYTKLTDREMECFSFLPQLQFLDLGNTAIGSLALQSLSGLVKLKSLFLDYTKIDDLGTPYLAKLTNLVDLNMGNTNISDATLSHLTSLTNLMDLKVGHTTVSDVGLIHFSCLSHLMYVYLDGTNVRDAGVTYLTTIMPHLHVQIRLDTSGIQF